MTVLKRIQADLVEADVNNDGRIDFLEIQLVLAKYPETFSQDDIERIGELFYVGRSGSSVRHSTFLRGIQYVLRNGGSNSGNKNPLQMESLNDQRCWVSPEEAAAKEECLYNVQAQFEQSLSEYVEAVSAEKKEPGS